MPLHRLDRGVGSRRLGTTRIAPSRMIPPVVRSCSTGSTYHSRWLSRPGRPSRQATRGKLMATYRVRVLNEETYIIEAESLTDALSDWRDQEPEESVVTDIHGRIV